MTEPQRGGLGRDAGADNKDPGQDRNINNQDAGTAAAILAAAALMMPDYGYGRVTVRDLARRAGVGLGTVYGHFRGKEEIAAALVERDVAAVHAAMAALFRVSLAPGERLRHLLEARVTVRFEQSRRQRHPVNEGTPELESVLAPRRAAWREAERALLTDAVLLCRGEVFSGVAGETVCSGVASETVVLGRDREAAASSVAQALLWATDGLVAEALLPLPDALGPTPQGPSSTPEALSSEALSPPADPWSGSEAASLSHRIRLVAELLVAGVETAGP